MSDHPTEDRVVRFTARATSAVGLCGLHGGGGLQNDPPTGEAPESLVDAEPGDTRCRAMVTRRMRTRG